MSVLLRATTLLLDFIIFPVIAPEKSLQYPKVHQYFTNPYWHCSCS